MTKEQIWKAIEAYRSSGGREEYWRSRDVLDALIDEVFDRIDDLQTMEPMTEVADRYAHRLALAIECMLSTGPDSTRWWNEGLQVLSEYRSAMNDIHEQHSPTHMGEPLI